MTDEKVPTPRPGRRTFLLGLLTGAGVATALGAGQKVASARPSAAEPRSDPAAPMLYRRTEETERYYRTLYH